MSRKILCYSNLNTIFKTELNKYLEYPVITATKGLEQMINAASVSYIGINMGDLVRKAVPEWQESSWKFRCYLQMKKILREYAPKSEQERMVISSFQRNMNDVMRSILALEEAEVYPQYLDEKLAEYKIFKYIWMRMEEEIPELASMNSAFQYQYTTKDAITKLINDFLEKEDSSRRVAKIDKIVLLGFYYITPLQKRLIDGIENASIELVFLNCYNSKYPKLYDVWMRCYDLAYNDNNWYGKKLPDETETDIGKIFAGEVLTDAFRNVNIIEYKNDLAFVNDITRILDEERTIFASNKKEANNILKEFYPEMYKKKHILSYPIGQFIYYLHSMWDGTLQQVCLDMNALRHCFASGWLVVDGIRAQEYAGVLDKMEVYFKNCHTATEWKSRLINLRDAKFAVQVFDKAPKGVPEENSRWHQIVGNPFAKFSVFNESYEDIRKVVTLVLHLIHMAEVLFGNGEEINLSNHMVQLKKILTEQGKSAAVYDEEKAIIQELLNSIENPKSKAVECFPDDVCDAMQILLGGGFEEEDEDEISRLSINALIQIEAFTIHTQKKIHICMCDENSMPGKNAEYSWPISEHFLNGLHIPDGANGNNLLKLYRFYVESKGLSNRYLISEALKLEDVELSWISQKENKKIEKSIYLRLIDDASKKIIRKAEYEQEDIMTLIRSVKEEDPKTIGLKGTVTIPEEVQMDYLLCSHRYFYGYVLETMPSYNSEFQYNFLIASLIKTLAKVSAVRVDELQDEVFKMFPYLRDIEKQQILDYVYIPKEDTKTYMMDSVIYPGERLEMHFLNKQVKELALERYKAYEKALAEHENIVFEVDLEKCKYCPHINYCRQFSLMDTGA